MEKSNNVVGRQILRLLALVALVAAAIAIYSVVNSGLKDSGNGGTPTQKKAGKGKPVPDDYVVQEGDSLSTIASKFKIPLQVLEQLNPEIDPKTLNTGQRVRLKPEKK